MKTFKTLILISIICLVLISCKRRHTYCVCKTPPNSNLKPFDPDWGTRNSLNNFKADKKRCEDKEKEGYTDCSFSAE